MSERMTWKEREEKFLPVIQKLLAATEANGAFLKAKDKNVAADELQRLEETKNSAKQSATSIQSGSGVIDVIMTADILDRRIWDEATTADGKGGYTVDLNKAYSMSQAFRSLLDDRDLPRNDKDQAKRRPAIRDQRREVNEHFISACRATSYNPANDNERGKTVVHVKRVLERLSKRVGELNAQVVELKKGSEADRLTAQELNQEALNLNSHYRPLSGWIEYMTKKLAKRREEQKPKNQTSGFKLADTTGYKPEAPATEATSVTPEAPKEMPTVSKRTRRSR